VYHPFASGLLRQELGLPHVKEKSLAVWEKHSEHSEAAMARNAGFAVVASFSENWINRVIRVYHANLVTPFQFALPSPINVGGTQVNAQGSLMVLPPRVTLRTNANDQVTVWIGFGGRVVLTGGGQTLQEQIILTTTVSVGLITNVANNQVTVGLNLANATVNSLTATVLNGPALAPLFNAALTAPAVLAALSTALQSLPPALVQFTPGGFNLPLNYTQTYEPPSGPIPNPDPLFSVSLSSKRAVARPITSAGQTTGALVVGVDSFYPVFTGDASALVDLNTIVSPHGYMIDYQRDGTPQFGMTGGGAHNSDVAFAINGALLSSIVDNNISPQLSDKFISDHVAFAYPQINDGQPPTYDCLSLSFGSFTPPLSGTPLDGMLLKAHMTYFPETTIDLHGYPVGDFVDQVDAYVTIGADMVMHTFETENPSLPRWPSGVQMFNVAFTTNPVGGFLYVDGGLVRLGLGPYASTTIQLPQGRHRLSAVPGGFQSWQSTGNIQINSPNTPTTDINVQGDGAITLQQSTWIPFLTQDFWTADVPYLDIELPWWLTLLEILFGPVYGVVGFIAGIAGSDIWVSDIVENARTQAQRSLIGGIDGALSATAVSRTMNVLQLPNTTVPNWLTVLKDFVLSSEGPESYLEMTLLPPGMALGSPGSFPYLLVTDQDVTDPTQIPDLPNPLGGFPQRVDGAFSWPGINWNQNPGAGGVTIDVRQLNPISVVLKIPQGLFQPQDPSVYVHWQVSRADTGQKLIDKTLGIGQAGAFANIFTVTIDHASAPLQEVAEFAVTCSLFRPLDGINVEQIFSAQVNVAVVDHFDRRHPFVQWGSYTSPVYPGQPYWNERRVLNPKRRWIKKVRTSRIHRTDVWNGGRRCVVADTSGHGFHLANKLKGKGLVDKHDQGRDIDFPWIYVDQLPISLDDVRKNRDLARGVLCDYCFFGGPSKTQLRNDFPR
jgi:hypothetical protein